MRYLVSLLLFLLHPLGAFAGFTGSVVSVLDGDTIEVLHHPRPKRIRHNSIDGPEKGADECVMDSVSDGVDGLVEVRW